jgi:outer membrane protein TolC
MEWKRSAGRRWGAWVPVVAVLLAAGPARAADEAGSDKILGRFPAVEEDGRRLAKINLRDLLQLVMERNLLLQSSAVSQDAARQSLKAAQERLQPTFNSSLAYTRAISPVLSTTSPGSPAGAPFLFVSGQNSETLSAGISQQDWLGNIYSMTYQETSFQNQLGPVQKEGDSPTFASPRNYKDYSSLSGTVTIPLAQNSGRAFNRVPVGQAEVGVRTARLATRKQELATLNTVALAYWNLVGQLEVVTVNEEAVRLDQRVLGDNRIRLQAGTIASADVLASEAQLAKDQFNLVQSRLQAQNLEDQLRQAIGLEGFDFGLRPTDVPTLRPAEHDLNEQLERVYRNNPDLASLQASLENNGYDLVTAENAAKSQLNLALSYVFNGYSKDPFVGSAYYGQTQTQGYVATLNYSLPLFDRVGPANIQRRVLERQALELQIRDQRTSLNIQLQTALRNIRQAQEQETAARTSVDLSKVQLQNEIDKLAQGRSTAFTVAQVQQQLAQSQQLEIAARVQFEQNDAARMALTAELFDHYSLDTQSIDPP